LTPDGLPRFRRLIVTVGRQSGKTRSVEDLTLFWIFDEEHASVLGTSTLTKYAKKPWKSAFDLAVRNPDLAELMPENPHRRAIRKAAGEEEWWTSAGCHYAVAASNAEGGRSMSNQRVIADEFAKQYTYDAYGAAYYSMDAFENAQYWALTTPDAKGEPYRDLRGAALKFIEDGEGDPSLGLFEWSCPPDADPTDLAVLAMANPTLNRPGGKSGARLLREAAAAVAKGGQLLEVFRTEIMCILGEDVDAAIDLEAWARGLDPATLDGLRGRLVLCFDAAPSMLHATLYAAAVQPDGRIRVEPVEAWEGRGCVDQAARELRALVAKVKPRAFGWLPTGPAAAVGARLADRNRPGRREWPPPGVEVAEIRGELTQVSMGFSQLIAADQILHSGDPLLDSQVAEAEKRPVGDAWRYSRRGEGDVDAVYAAAGAVFLAQTLPASDGRMRVLLPTVR
jgi:phage terminase large subunit-like protein